VGDIGNGVSSQRSHVRRYLRAPVTMGVSYTLDGETENRHSHSSDLGGGGLRLATHEDLALGTVLLLRFTLPGAARETVARGRIVLSFFNADSAQFHHGIAFTQIDPRDQETIVAFVSAEVDRGEAQRP
jgi:c-di-GMP-binding flagellar brake protein YcgR